ncbi:uncharacterized protein [Arachis hypogaea]|uniref:uncharacterized protein n=1 Tax=Arachis hypogaea TaxID=3818 RepID=UPI003B2234D7
MRVLSQNCQDLKRPLTVHNLKGMYQSHSSDIVFICETKNQSHLVKCKLQSCHFTDWRIVTDIAGELALAWKEGTAVEVEILVEKEFFIVVKVTDRALNCSWRLIGVYLNSLDGIRSIQYTEFFSLVQYFLGKVVIIGIFNAIVSLNEKEGGGLKSASSISEIVNFIDDDGLKNLGMIGRRFTWTNKQRGQDQIREQFDCALTNGKWMDHFLSALLSRLVENGSDHALILLNTNSIIENLNGGLSFRRGGVV